VAVFGRLVQKCGRDSSKGETIHRTIKNRIHKIENKIQKQNNRGSIMKTQNTQNRKQST
jgi:hypothetical protein